MSEKWYILVRKLRAFGNSLCFYFCRVFPIKNNRICICTFEGKGGFCCNPKYIALELHKSNPELELVWLVNDMSKEFPEYIKKVPNTLWSRAYWLSTSHIWIDNYRKPYGTKKRKNQYYLNTNHFTLGIKCTGLLRGDGFSKMAYLVSKNDSDMIDGLLIDSKWCEQCFDKAMLYNGPLLKYGSPRCDVLYGDRTECKRRFKSRHGLNDDAKVVMFAPTFREWAENGKRFVFSEPWSIDFERLIDNLENRFGGKWYICLRVHPQLADTFKGYHSKDSMISERLIDESRYVDFYELLAAMDAYITDYSSAIFEAGYAHIPAFIYADDIKEYANSRGCLYWYLDSSDRKHISNNKKTHPNMDLILPFPVSRNNEQLEEDILDFDQIEYDHLLDKLHEEIRLTFDGQAGFRQAKHILRIIDD